MQFPFFSHDVNDERIPLVTPEQFPPRLGDSLTNDLRWIRVRGNVWRMMEEFSLLLLFFLLHLPRNSSRESPVILGNRWESLRIPTNPVAIDKNRQESIVILRNPPQSSAMLCNRFKSPKNPWRILNNPAQSIRIDTDPPPGKEYWMLRPSTGGSGILKNPDYLSRQESSTRRSRPDISRIAAKGSLRILTADKSYLIERRRPWKPLKQMAINSIGCVIALKAVRNCQWNAPGHFIITRSYYAPAAPAPATGATAAATAAATAGPGTASASAAASAATDGPGAAAASTPASAAAAAGAAPRGRGCRPRRQTGDSDRWFHPAFIDFSGRSNSSGYGYATTADSDPIATPLVNFKFLSLSLLPSPSPPLPPQSKILPLWILSLGLD